MAPAPSPTDPLGISGYLIAEKYRVESLVGEGGHSVVYRAQQTIWNDPVAIKFYRSLSQAPESAREQLLGEFIQEGRLLANLSSRSAAIVQARDVGTLTTPEGLWIPYMVLEWLEGASLGMVLDTERERGFEPRSLHDLIALLEPVAIALEVAHNQGVAHRDIKPDNLFVIGDPRGVAAMVKVLDFGVAKIMAGPGGTALVQTGSTITAFTPRYGAPEQFNRAYGATGPWSDVYALALVLLEVMRNGIPVFSGDDLMVLASQSCDPNRRPTPTALGLDVPPAVEAVFARALAISPSQRFPSAGVFWTALHQATFPDAAMWTPGLSQGGPAPVAGGHMPPPGSPAVAPPGSQQQPWLEGQPPVEQTGPTQFAPMEVRLPSGSRTAPTVEGARAKASRLPFIAVGLALVAFGAGGYAANHFLGSRAGGASTSPTASTLLPGDAGVVAPLTSAAPPIPARATTCAEGMLLVPGGKFFMGSDDAAFKLWQPAHKVTVDTFCMDRTEVTVDAYGACVTAGACERPAAAPDYPKSASTTDAEHEKNRAAYSELCNFGKPGRDKHPVNCVSWERAQAFCSWRKGRLPTEAEWEYAARGSDGRTFPWGDDPGTSAHMNACGKECNRWEADHGLKLSQRMYDEDDGYPGSAPVGSFPKGRTKVGIDDVVGNVWEWTGDWFETYKPDEAINPSGAPAGDRKAIRGGGFNGGVQLWLNPAFRFHQLATASSHGIGFRCASVL